VAEPQKNEKTSEKDKKLDHLAYGSNQAYGKRRANARRSKNTPNKK
jgi:hypothetical protein